MVMDVLLVSTGRVAAPVYLLRWYALGQPFASRGRRERRVGSGQAAPPPPRDPGRFSRRHTWL